MKQIGTVVWFRENVVLPPWRTTFAPIDSRSIWSEEQDLGSEGRGQGVRKSLAKLTKSLNFIMEWLGSASKTMCFELFLPASFIGMHSISPSIGAIHMPIPTPKKHAKTEGTHAYLTCVALLFESRSMIMKEAQKCPGVRGMYGMYSMLCL